MPLLSRAVLFSLACLTLIAAPAAAVPPGAETPTTQIELRMPGAAFRGEGPGDDAAFIWLLRKTDDAWLTAYGTARDLNANVHAARVSDATLTDGRLALTLDVTVHGDSGGFGRYTVTTERGEGGTYRGRFEGTFRGVAVEGDALAELLPPTDVVEGFRGPPEPGEHPRILFRRADLPALRAKAKTPLGKAALDAMTGPVALGIKYQLTADQSLAQQAIAPVQKMIERGMLSDQYGNNVGARLEQVAITYDLCYDAWPTAFRERVERYLRWAGVGVLRSRRDTHQGVNWHVCSNWSAPLYTGAAYAGLALWGKPGAKPQRPADTHTGAEVAPAADYQPGEGVPVSGFESGEMPGAWLVAGGFKTDDHDGEPIDDPAAFRPGVGTEVTFGGKTVAFKPLSEEKDKGYWAHESYDDGKRMIDITNAVGREYFSTNYFYSVIRNDAARWVRVDTTYPATVYLNGTPLRAGEVARLQPGLYPVLVGAYIDQINPWGRQLMRPRLTEIDADEAARLAVDRKAAHERAVAAWGASVAEWERLGRIDHAALDLFERSRHMMYVFCREAVGDGGFTAEITHYGGIAERDAATYFPAHLRMFGHHVSPQADIELLVPRKMFVHLYPEGDGDPRAVEINGTPKVDNGLFAPLLPVVPEAMRGAALWGWHRHAGFEGEEWSKLVAKSPVWALLNYPLDGGVDPTPPGDASAGLPLTWRADTFGFYGFRDRFENADDTLLQVFAKAHWIGGWNGPNAGTIRLQGLGHLWTGAPTDRNRHRPEESVVQLPEDEGLNLSDSGVVTHVQTRGDGSGVVSIDLRDVYATAKTFVDGRGRTRKHRRYSRYGHIRLDDAFADSGITGMRSVGVDYSGKSGAAAVIVLVDKVDGGGKKVWTWALPHSTGKADEWSAVDRTSTDGNTFTVTQQDGATLRGTFVTGQRPEAKVRQTAMTGGGGSTKGKTLQRPVHGVFAEDDAKDAGFFVVLTLQNGDPPAVTVEGEGLDAVVKIGEQTVRFDGEKVVFGE